MTTRTKATVTWRKPTASDRPEPFAGVLVVYRGHTFAGVYQAATQEVKCWPESFGKVKLADCTWWTTYPTPPQSDLP